MGGMFTILKVRESLRDANSDPGWYQVPMGTGALPATDEALGAADISADGSRAPRASEAAMRPHTQAPVAVKTPDHLHHDGQHGGS